LTAALSEVNAAYAAGGSRSLARDALFSRNSGAKRVDGLDVVKKHGR
jgi:hypothetical protein